VIRVGLFTAACMILAEVAGAATVRFDVRPAGGRPGDTVDVLPGGELAYEVTAEVVTPDPMMPDNDGLALFMLDIETNLTVAQERVEFAPAIAAAFALFQSRGTPAGDDIHDISAAQDVASGAVLIGVGRDGPEPLVSGRLRAPEAVGTYRVSVRGVPQATVLVPGSADAPHVQSATVESGAGFDLQVVLPDPGPQTGSPSPWPCGGGAGVSAALALCLMELTRRMTRSPAGHAPANCNLHQRGIPP